MTTKITSVCNGEPSFSSFLPLVLLLSCSDVSDCHSPFSWEQHFVLMTVWIKANFSVRTQQLSFVRPRDGKGISLSFFFLRRLTRCPENSKCVVVKTFSMMNNAQRPPQLHEGPSEIGKQKEDWERKKATFWPPPGTAPTRPPPHLDRSHYFSGTAAPDRHQTTRQPAPTTLVEHGRAHELDANFFGCRKRKVIPSENDVFF